MAGVVDRCSVGGEGRASEGDGAKDNGESASDSMLCAVWWVSRIWKDVSLSRGSAADLASAASEKLSLGFEESTSRTG